MVDRQRVARGDSTIAIRQVIGARVSIATVAGSRTLVVGSDVARGP